MSQFVLYTCKERSIEDISTLMNQKNRNITTLRIVNSDSLQNLSVKKNDKKGIQMFQKLQNVNLSSNMIERVTNLNQLRFLRSLNLSANQIRVIHGLKGLFSLENLNLSGNKIVSLMNLRQVI